MLAGTMRAVFARGNAKTVELLLELRKEAGRDQEPRVAQRFHAIALSIEGQTVSQIARSLKVHRSSVPFWIQQWNSEREVGLLEGHRAGRPTRLTIEQQEQLRDILDSGPVAYGLESGIWTSPIISGVITQEFGVGYHPGHVRKLLRRLGYSVQRPTTRLVQADPVQKNRWIRYTYPRLKKKPGRKGR
jgi:transposase